MTRRAATLLIGFYIPLGIAAGEPPSIIRETIEIAEHIVSFQVAAKNGKAEETGLCTALTAGDLELVINGRPAEILSLIHEEPPAFHAILIDNSGSMEGALGYAHKRAIEYVDAMRPGEVAQIFTIDETFVRRTPPVKITDARSKEILTTAIRQSYSGGQSHLREGLTTAFLEVGDVWGPKLIVFFTDAQTRYDIYSSATLAQLRTSPDITDITPQTSPHWLYDLRSWIDGRWRVTTPNLGAAIDKVEVYVDPDKPCRVVGDPLYKPTLRKDLEMTTAILPVPPDEWVALHDQGAIQNEWDLFNAAVNIQGPAIRRRPPKKDEPRFVSDNPACSEISPDPFAVETTGSGWALKGCILDLVRDPGKLFSAAEKNLADYYNEPLIQHRPLHIPVAPPESLINDPVDILTLFFDAELRNVEKSRHSEGELTSMKDSPYFANGRTILAYRPAIRKALLRIPAYRDWAKKRLRDDSEPELRKLLEKWQALYPETDPQTVKRALLESPEGMRLTKLIEFPLAEDLFPYLAKSLGDVPATELFRGLDARLTHRFLRGEIAAADISRNIAAWHALRNRFALPVQVRTIALTPYACNADRTQTGFYNVLLPSPTRIEKIAQGAKKNAPPDDLIPSEPLGLLLAQRLTESGEPQLTRLRNSIQKVSLSYNIDRARPADPRSPMSKARVTILASTQQDAADESCSFNAEVSLGAQTSLQIVNSTQSCSPSSTAPDVSSRSSNDLH